MLVDSNSYLLSAPSWKDLLIMYYALAAYPVESNYKQFTKPYSSIKCYYMGSFQAELSFSLVSQFSKK